MPPQPGMFALPYSSTHKPRGPNGTSDVPDANTSAYHANSMNAGPSRGTPFEDPKNRKRKEIAGKLSKEMNDRREIGHYNSARYYNDTISDLTGLSLQLATRPETVPAYQLRLYPLSIERSALLASLGLEEKNALDCIQTAYQEEQERVEDEWKKGRDKIRERLMEGIEERRKRAREEKEGEGAVGDASLDSQSRPHITRKLRNKLGGTSPPPTPLNGTPGNGGASSAAAGPITSGPFLNPHSLSVDELPSPFPLPLTSTHASSNGGGNGPGNRRRAKGGGKEAQALGAALGKPGQGPLDVKDADIESDMIEIRRNNKRRRVVPGGGLAGK
ncbi:hypothetical protein PHLCEN_2v6004 [Hermanssonia centrifuga]|uniref:Uncharacterized protein n=1 Tax=Hermanssonia centrifuga TaxID=98765 RepID=A0A2R6P163_9APHY|nr:hypothetical protein PHLCEN_2v6004 [Hermanssonia centrifuga]